MSTPAGPELGSCSLLRALARPWERSPPEGAPSAQALDLARTLSLEPLLAARARARDGAPLQARLDDVRRRARVRVDQARRELGETIAVLDGAGVRVAALKGVTLAARFPVGIAARVTSDLDLLLLDRWDRGRATTALSRLGYRTAAPTTPDSLVAPGRLPIDLHDTLAKRHFRPAGGPRPTRVVLQDLGAGVTSPTLDAPWTIAFAAVQLHQDFPSLRRLVDLAMLMGTTSQDDAAQALDLARAFGVSAVLVACARLAERWLEAPLPASWGACALPRLPRALLRRWDDPALWLGVHRRTALDRDQDLTGAGRYLDRLLLLDDGPRVAPGRILWRVAADARGPDGWRQRLARLVGAPLSPRPATDALGSARDAPQAGGGRTPPPAA